MKKKIKQYIRKVKQRIRCPKKVRSNFIDTLTESVEDYINENPDCTDKDIEEYFGTPDEVALEFMKNIKSEELERYLTLQKRLKLLIVVIILAILIVFCISLYMIVTSEVRFVTETIY